MIVIIEDEVFALPQSGLSLPSVFYLGWAGPHRIQTDPLYNPASNAALNHWLAGLSQQQREEAEFVLSAGLERDALDIPSELSIRIAKVEGPEWDLPVPRLPLAVAFDLLRKPLRVILEDWHNDGAFLRSVPPAPWRQELQKTLKRQWIEIEHGGGSGMKTRVDKIYPEEALRRWALFDSDAREPGRPSKAQATLQKSCKDRGIAHHLLQRRAIENYLPIKALQAWVVKSPGKVREQRRRTVKAFAQMQPAQRHHYNLKSGFAGDRKRSEVIPALFADVVEHIDLQRGMVEDISSLFHQEGFEIPEEWFREDGQHEETLSMVQSILRRL